MKTAFRYVFRVLLPLAGLTALFGSCASSHSSCNNDACYSRNLASVDPYEDGDIAEWGTEKAQKARERQMQRSNRQ